MEVVHITDKIYYYNDQGRFKHFNQLRFFFVDAVIPTGKRWKETTEENLVSFFLVSLKEYSNISF